MIKTNTRREAIIIRKQSEVVQQGNTGRWNFTEGQTPTDTTIWGSIEYLSGSQQVFRGLQGMNSPVKIMVLTDDISGFDGEYIIVHGTNVFSPVSVRTTDPEGRNTEIIAQLRKQ